MSDAREVQCTIRRALGKNPRIWIALFESFKYVSESGMLFREGVDEAHGATSPESLRVETDAETQARVAKHVHLPQDATGATQDVFLAPDAKPSTFYYKFMEDGVDDVEFGPDSDEPWVECSRRHPGDAYESDDETTRLRNHLFQPCRTLAGGRLFGIAFAAAAVASTEEPSFHELKAAYPLQLSVRLDDERLQLIYDCLTFCPHAWHPELSPMPSMRERAVFDLMQLPFEREVDRDAEYDRLQRDPALDEEVSCPPARDSEQFQRQRMVQKLACHASDLLYESRTARVRFPIAAIVGARIVTTQRETMSDPGILESRNVACLILELNDGDVDGEDNTAGRKKMTKKKTAASMSRMCSFAVCDVHAPGMLRNSREEMMRRASRQADGRREPNFVTSEDWTPHRIASRASRHYITGARAEVVELATKLAAVSPAVAAMLCAPSRQCAQCLALQPKDVGQGKLNKFKMCAACKCPVYCSPECQKLHWKKAHKKQCKAWRGGTRGVPEAAAAHLPSGYAGNTLARPASIAPIAGPFFISFCLLRLPFFCLLTYSLFTSIAIAAPPLSSSSSSAPGTLPIAVRAGAFNGELPGTEERNALALMQLMQCANESGLDVSAIAAAAAEAGTSAAAEDLLSALEGWCFQR
jgi:hypothetical protein